MVGLSLRKCGEKLRRIMMSYRTLSRVLFAWILVAGGQMTTAQDATPSDKSKESAMFVPTFHCLSVYWSPENGQAAKKVLVKFRESGEKTWHDGLSMRYN